MESTNRSLSKSILNDSILLDKNHAIMQIIPDNQEKKYTSMYIDNVLDSLGYNNPLINNEINTIIEKHTTNKQPVNIDKIIINIKDLLKPYLDRSYSSITFNRNNFSFFFKQQFLIKHKTEILCLESESLDFTSDDSDVITSVMDQVNIFDQSAIKEFLKGKKKKAGLFVVNPYCFREGRLFTIEELQPLVSQIVKTGIPIVWVESTIGLCYSGSFFSYDYYGITPDMIVFSSPVLSEKAIHMLICKKRMSSHLRNFKISLDTSDALNLIVFNVLIKYLVESELQKHIKTLENRLLGKTRALAASATIDFSYSGIGLFHSYQFKTKEMANSFYKFMTDKCFIVHQSNHCPNTVHIHPPLIIVNSNIDAFIDVFRTFITQ